MLITPVVISVIFLGLCACSGGSEETMPTDSELSPETGSETGTGGADGTDGADAPAAPIPKLPITSQSTSAIGSYNASTGRLTVASGETTVVLDSFATANIGALAAVRDAGGIHNAYIGNGSGTRVIVYSGGLAGNVVQNAVAVRTAASDLLPSSGSATFAGVYAGFTSTRRINGDAQLSVDFGAGVVEGSITNRLFRFRPDNVFDGSNDLTNIRLEEASITSSGTFSGTAANGQIVNGQEVWNPASGSYDGVFGGDNTSEVAGTVTLLHRSASGSSIQEVGGFLATR